MDVQLTIDGRVLDAQTGETVLEVAARHAIYIPTLCHFKGLSPLDTCLVCVVELAGQDALVPACATPVALGMNVTVTSDRLQAARRGAVELLLSEHRGECLAPCEIACPAGLDIPGFLQALPVDAKAAAALAVRGLALPATLGWICDAPCQRACRRGEIDSTIDIRALHLGTATREVFSDLDADPRAPATGKRVAVVGSGPAGLAAALRTLLHGHACTLYEQELELGGTLRASSESVLPAAVLATDLAVLQRLGLHVQTGVRLGRELEWADLLASFDAVVLATGDASDLPALADPRTVRAGAAAGRAGKAVRVVADGLAAADAIDRLLMAKPAPPARIRVRYGELDQAERTFLYRNADPGPASVVADAAEAARQEALRCLACGCADHDACALRLVAGALAAVPKRFEGAHRPMARDDSHADLVYESHKCILCQACVRLAEPSAAYPGLTIAGRGFACRVVAPLDQPLATALDSATALRIAAACPTNAMREKSSFERKR